MPKSSTRLFSFTVIFSVAAAMAAACAAQVNDTDRPTQDDDAGIGGSGGAGGNAEGGSDGGAPPICSDGLKPCAGECVDTASNPDFCGSCSNACREDQVCLSGGCYCSDFQIECGLACVDPVTDPKHCGGCAIECDDACINAECKLMCDAGETPCANECVDTMTDDKNCGGCFNVCGPDLECTGGNCLCSDVGLCNTCSPTVLSGALPIDEAGNSTGAPSLMEASCGGDDGPEIAYTFEATADAMYKFDTEGTGFDTVLYVLDDSCTELDCNDDDVGLTSSVTVSLTTGQQVVVVVDGFDDLESGPFNLHITNP